MRLIEEIIAADAGKAQYLVLENVAAITQSKMEKVWREVLGSLARLNYRAAWTTISARNVGCFMNRTRWILVARRGDAPPLECPILSKAAFREQSRRRWNPYWREPPPPSCWLLPREGYDTECVSRLKMCGNVVVPAQLHAAVQILSSLAF